MLNYTDESEYLTYYLNHICATQVTTSLGFPVIFRRDRFTHAFYVTDMATKEKTGVFSFERASRMDEILPALRGDPDNVLWLAGWNRDANQYDHNRCVCLNVNDLAIILGVSRNPNGGVRKGNFITCYPATPETLAKMKQGPIWNEYQQWKIGGGH